MPDTHLRVVMTDPYPGVPGLWIYFTVDDATSCTLQSVTLARLRVIND